MASTADFRLSITRALSDQLSDAISTLSPISLSADNIANVSSRGGVYQLFRGGALVYIGKADGSLSDRLANHYRKLSGRSGISVEQMAFVALYVDEDLSAVAPERLLIGRHRGAGESPWNYNGFGNKDPGRERDTSRVKAGHFDELFPINIDEPLDSIAPGDYLLGDLLLLTKARLPYLFRFEGGNLPVDRQPAIYRTARIEVPATPRTARTMFELLSQALDEWQITVLPGYVIMYRESRSYLSAQLSFP